MFDIDAGKLLIIGLVALLVIGPKDLPRVLRQVGQMVARLRKMAGEFQGQFMEAMKEADLQDLRAEVAKLKESATLDVNFDPAHDVRTELTSAINGPATPSSAPPSIVPGSTSEAHSFQLPSPSEVGAGPSPASAGFAPVAEAVPADATSGLPDSAGASEETAYAIPGRRKILVTRRRSGSRFEGPVGRGPAPNRPRNIRPARRETADQ